MLNSLLHLMECWDQGRVEMFFADMSTDFALPPGCYSEFTQQDGRKKRRAKCLCDKYDRAISYVFCCNPHLTLIFSGLLQKDLFKGRSSLAEIFFKQNYCHACHTRVAVFFPVLSCYVSSLVTENLLFKVANKFIFIQS